MNNTNPPAIVKEAEAFSLRQLAKRIRPKLRKEATNCMEIGEDMERIFGMVTGRPRQAFLTKEFGITERQAWKYLRAWRARDRIRENPSEPEFMDDGLPESLAAAMRILDEDHAPEPVKSNGDVPFAPPPKAPEAPIREPGGDESYQEMQAKKQAVLCPRCARLKSPGCDQCRVKWFNLDNPRPKADEGPKPTSPAKKKPTDNGQLMFDWQDWNGHFGAVVRGIDRLAVVGNIPNVNPKLEGLRLKAGELLAEFKAVSTEILKQKPPE